MDNDLAAPLRLATAAALSLAVTAPVAHAANEFVTPGHFLADDKCASVGERGIVLAGHGINASGNRPKVWRTGDPALTFGGGEVRFTVWGNVDLASSITLNGITHDGFTVESRRNGAENTARGCGAHGSVDITVKTAKFPPAAQNGRLRFTFPVGAPFEVPLRLQPLPGGLDLRWPAEAVPGAFEGEHHACLEANGGHVRVEGDLLEIALNPDNPAPAGCDTFALEVFDLRGVPALRGAQGFLGFDNDPNVAVTVVQGNAATAGFASGLTSKLNRLAEMVRAEGRPDPSGRFAALRIDYAAAARALRAAPALQVTPATGNRSLTTGAFNRQAAATSPPVRKIEFTLAMPSFNNVPNPHAPMRVRLVEARAAARSDVTASFKVIPVCSNPLQVTVQERSTGSLPITRRALESGAGQLVNGGTQPITTSFLYPRPGNYTIALHVTDANGATNTARHDLVLPAPSCQASGTPVGGGGIRVGAGSSGNLLPARLFPERPLLRRIGGLGANVMVAGGFCAGLGNDARGQVQVPPLTWGASSAGGDVATARVELREDASGRVLSSFDARVPGNAAPVTRDNYPGRPTRVSVVNVTGPLMRDFGNQAGCFLDPKAPAPTLDPAFRLVVDPTNAVGEGPDAATGEADNELTF